MKLFFCENHQTKLRLPFTEWKKLKDPLERTLTLWLLLWVVPRAQAAAVIHKETGDMTTPGPYLKGRSVRWLTARTLAAGLCEASHDLLSSSVTSLGKESAVGWGVLGRKDSPRKRRRG